MKILAIETSCDDTGIAILEEKSGEFKVLSNIVSSQTIHQNYGGVFPMMAKREHQKNLVPVLKQALKQAKLANPKSQILNPKQTQNLKKVFRKEPDLYVHTKKFLEDYGKPEVDVIAVTYGPGLEPCLWTGVNFARALAYFWDMPIVPVNHIEAHILVNFLENQKIEFPAISLIVSGGHTQLILVKKIGKYKIIGETRDDAAGECFDKAAKILGLGYPGGPAIAKTASQWKSEIQSTKPETNSKFKILNSKFGIRLPRPMINTKDYDFSFSGLKTAVLYATRNKKQETITKQYVKAMCVEIQQAIIDVLIKKTIQAAKDFRVKTIILGGGVSANKELRKQFSEKVAKELSPPYDGRQKEGTQVIFPESSLSTDNALMIAVAGYFNRDKKINWKKLKAESNLRIS